MIRALSITLTVLVFTGSTAVGQEVTREGTVGDHWSRTQWAKADDNVPVAPSRLEEPKLTAPDGLGALIASGRLSPAGTGNRFVQRGTFDPKTNTVNLHTQIYHSATPPEFVVEVRFTDGQLVDAELVGGELRLMPPKGRTHVAYDDVLAAFLKHELSRGEGKARFRVRGWSVRIKIMGQPTRRTFLLTGIRAVKKSKPNDDLWLFDGDAPETPKFGWKRAVFLTDGGKLQGTLLVNLRIHRYSSSGEPVKAPKVRTSLVSKIAPTRDR